MVGFSKKRKSSKHRGSREMGRGRKKGRGAGLRGGRGNAGAHKHKRVLYETKLYGAEGGYWGREKGFKRPEAVVDVPRTLNVSEIDQAIERWVHDGQATKSGDTFTVDLTAMGIDKLLGSGQVTRKLALKVETATPGAIEKIKAAGGSVALAAEAPST